jgi:hypothetical protein
VRLYTVHAKVIFTMANTKLRILSIKIRKIHLEQFLLEDWEPNCEWQSWDMLPLPEPPLSLISNIGLEKWMIQLFPTPVTNRISLW